MRVLLLSLVLAGATFAAAPASANADVDTCTDCVVLDPGCYVSGIASVCATFTPDCTSVHVSVKGQTFWLNAGTPPVSQTVYGFDAGPIQVSDVTVTVDAVSVSYPVSTPGRSASNVFCTSEFLAISA